MELPVHCTHETLSGIHHYLVDGTHVALNFEVTFFGQTDVLVQHVGPWNPHLIKAHPPIIIGLHAHLSTQVSTFDPWHQLTRISVTYAHVEHLHSKVIVTDDQPGKDCSPVGPKTHLSGPELSGGEGGRVNHDLVCLTVQGSGSLKPSHVGPMA